MHWKTAQKQIWPQDGGVVTHLHYGYHLRIVQQQEVHLLANQTQVKASIGLCRPDWEKQIEQMLFEQGLPVTGWGPGYKSTRSSYNRPSLLSTILQTAREMVEASGQELISVAALQERAGLNKRTFTLHLLTLVEDSQGFIALDEACTTVRLSTWQEAMHASDRLIQSLEKRFNSDLVMPECQLGLKESHTLCDWCITASSLGSFSLLQCEAPYLQLSGEAADLDRFLQEQQLPLGWAATYGENVSQKQRLLQKILSAVGNDAKAT